MGASARWQNLLACGAALLALGAPARCGWRLTERSDLTRSGQAVVPAVSPDGRRVAYLVGGRLSVSDGPAVVTGRLWMLDRATGEAARVGRFNVDAVEGEQPVAFAPGAGGYAYVEGPRAAPVLWYVDAGGARFRVGNGRAAAFSPDGRYLAYIVWERSGAEAAELWLFDTRARESKRLTRRPAAAPLRVAAPPRFTADGVRVVFRVDDQLFSYVRTKGRTDQLIFPGRVLGFDVDAAGNVLFLATGTSADAAGGIYRLAADGRGSTLVFPAEELPSELAGFSAGPRPDTVLVTAATAAGNGLVACDLTARRWRFLAPAETFSRQPGGAYVALETRQQGEKRNVALETRQQGEKRNVALGRLVWTDDKR